MLMKSKQGYDDDIDHDDDYRGIRMMILMMRIMTRRSRLANTIFLPWLCQ